MSKIIPKKENTSPIPKNPRRVKLLKYVQGKWQVVDYGVPSKVKIYLAQGYLVQFN